MEIDNTIFQDRESSGKKRLFKMAMEKFKNNVFYFMGL